MNNLKINNLWGNRFPTLYIIHHSSFIIHHLVNFYLCPKVITPCKNSLKIGSENDSNEDKNFQCSKNCQICGLHLSFAQISYRYNL
jgi:hypothetical protein